MIFFLKICYCEWLIIVTISLLRCSHDYDGFGTGYFIHLMCIRNYEFYLEAMDKECFLLCAIFADERIKSCSCSFLCAWSGQENLWEVHSIWLGFDDKMRKVLFWVRKIVICLDFVTCVWSKSHSWEGADEWKRKLLRTKLHGFFWNLYFDPGILINYTMAHKIEKSINLVPLKF